jgi:hypothetical protein
VTAADVIRGWSNQLSGNRFMTGVFTATEAGIQRGTGGSVAAYTAVSLTRAGDGSVISSQGDVLFNDRKASIVRRPIQPFDAAHGDHSTFTFSLDGLLHIRSITWNGSETVTLQDIGNGLLMGWGSSIGNTGHPALWLIAVDPKTAQIPG